MFHVNASIALFVFWQSSHTWTLCFFSSRLPLTIFRSKHVHRSRYGDGSWKHFDVSMTFSIENFRFLLYRVAWIPESFQLRWLDRVLQFLTEKNEFFFPSAAFALYNNKKEREISGVAWTLLDREEHRLIMQV